MGLPHRTLALLLAGVLIGCGGGDENPTADADPNGIWTGTFTENGVDYSLSALVHDDYLIAFSPGARRLLEGEIHTRGTAFSGSARVYATGEGYLGQTAYGGSVRTGRTINGLTDGGARFDLRYSALYDRPSSLERIAGIWSRTEGEYTITLAIDGDGTLSGSDTEGCVYGGGPSILDAEHNLYRIVLEVQSCGTSNGTYTGYGALDDLQSRGDNNVLHYALTNPSFIVTGSLQRQ